MKALRMRPGLTVQEPRPDLRAQAGAGILGVIAVLGLIFALVQGTIFFRTKTSSRFLIAEKGKILAQQAAEAGVEENIADLGTRKLRLEPHMREYTTYSNKQLGNSTFTTVLTAMGMGRDGDTMQLVSQGKSAASSQTVRAKMRIRNYLDTNLRTILSVEPDTIITNTVATLPETTVTTVVQDPEAMPPLETTAAYTACMASPARKCDICHIPFGNPVNRQVIDVSKSAIRTHFDHHGDYVTTDGTCDIYNPREEESIAMVTRVVADTQIVDRSVYDTVLVVDTLARVQILSWK